MTKAPFPWFGGKRRVAHVAWRAFGADVPNYVEPFFGSGAVLLERPGGAGKIETVNDADRYLANFWRAVSAAPLDVARHADWPVNEADLHARHKWLVIGKGVHSNAGHAKRPHLAGMDKGVHQKRPQLAGDHIGHGVHSAQAYSPGRRPAISSGGQGVHFPSLGNDRGLNGVSAAPCEEWFLQLQQRLRRVRVACGDWRRVLGPSVLGKGKNVGGRRPCAVFLDPPYSHELRNTHLYSEDDPAISTMVREWALEHGNDPDLRIALCGYEGEHEMPGWTEHVWKGARGYAGEDNDNASKERIWFSPHCLPLEGAAQLSLLEAP